MEIYTREDIFAANAVQRFSQAILRPQKFQVSVRKNPEPSSAMMEMLEAIQDRDIRTFLPLEDQIKREAVIASSLRRDEISRSALSEFTSAFRMSSYRRH